MKNIAKHIVFFLCLSFFIYAAAQAAFQEPTESFPGGEVDAPIVEGNSQQTKSGTLILGELRSPAIRVVDNVDDNNYQNVALSGSGLCLLESNGGNEMACKNAWDQVEGTDGGGGGISSSGSSINGMIYCSGGLDVWGQDYRCREPKIDYLYGTGGGSSLEIVSGSWIGVGSADAAKEQIARIVCMALGGRYVNQYVISDGNGKIAVLALSQDGDWHWEDAPVDGKYITDAYCSTP